jgi:branched-chain amino acid transport system substrate-binding protein
MRQKWLSHLCLLAILAILAAACGGGGGEAEETESAAGGGESETEAESEPESETEEASESESEAAAAPSGANGGQDGVLRLGYVLPETGDLAFLGPPMINGANFAVQEINAAGGVLGQPVEAFPGDSSSDPEGTVANQTVDRHLAQGGVDAIIGAAASGISLTVIDKVTDAGVILFSPANTSPELTDYDDNNLYFRTAPTDILQSQVQAELWSSEGCGNVQVLARADSYGRNFAELAVESFTETGGTAEIISYDFQAQNFDAEVGQALAANPDCVAIIGFEESGRILQNMISAGAGPADIPIFGTDGNASSTLWESVDPNNPAVIQGMQFSNPGANNEEFFGRLQAFAPTLEDTLYAPESYDAVVIIALAAEIAGEDGGATIGAHINDVTRGGEKCTTFQQCAELIRGGTTDIDYDGVSGPGEFVDQGEPSVANYQVLEVGEDGALDPVDQLQVTLE